MVKIVAGTINPKINNIDTIPINVAVQLANKIQELTMHDMEKLMEVMEVISPSDEDEDEDDKEDVPSFIV